jgi:hypothetical protein
LLMPPAQRRRPAVYFTPPHLVLLCYKELLDLEIGSQAVS